MPTLPVGGIKQIMIMQKNVMLRTGYVITYAGCKLLWCSKLQTEIALSAAEAEYIALIH